MEKEQIFILMVIIILDNIKMGNLMDKENYKLMTENDIVVLLFKDRNKD